MILAKDVYQTCSEKGVKVLSYSTARKAFERVGWTNVLGGECVAFPLLREEAATASACKWVIFYDETLPEDKKRECIARELEWVLRQKS